MRLDVTVADNRLALRWKVDGIDIVQQQFDFLRKLQKKLLVECRLHKFKGQTYMVLIVWKFSEERVFHKLAHKRPVIGILLEASKIFVC